MTQRRRTWLRWLLLGCGGIAVWQLACHFGQRSGPANLVNQIWLERWPRDARDMVWHFVAIDQKDRRVGSLGKASRWRVASDAFVWSQEGAELRARFPQNDCRLSFEVRSWKCAGEAPEPFELCLEVKANGRVYRYFSRTEWVVHPHGEVDEQLAWLTPAVQAAFIRGEDETPEERGGAGACAAFGPSLE